MLLGFGYLEAGDVLDCYLLYVFVSFGHDAYLIRYLSLEGYSFSRIGRKCGRGQILRVFGEEL